MTPKLILFLIACMGAGLYVLIDALTLPDPDHEDWPA